VCPPHTPLPAQTRALLDGYGRAVLMQVPAWQGKRIAAALERDLFLAGTTRPSASEKGLFVVQEVRFRRWLPPPAGGAPSMEACGIDVYATARGQWLSHRGRA